MSSKNDVLFVILNFNGWKETLDCLEAVLAQSYTNHHTLLIDNGSHDSSLQELSKYNNHKKVTFIKQPTNLGFAGGVNVGITHAIENNYENVVLLNNDAVLEKSWLRCIKEATAKQDASIFTGLLLNGNGKKIESTGDSYSVWGLAFPRQRDEPASRAFDSGFVFGGTAGASLYRTKVFEDFGLFDEDFFAYYEDTDINFRAQLYGYKAYYEKKAVAYHEHGTTSSKIPGFTTYQTFKNTPLVVWKNTPIILLPATLLRFYIFYTLLYTRAVFRGQFIVATKGIIRTISLTPHAFGKRKIIQKNRRVSVEYIKGILHPDLPPSNKEKIRRIFNR
jgi:GT2 family glycosyltransferase